MQYGGRVQFLRVMTSSIVTVREGIRRIIHHIGLKTLIKGPIEDLRNVYLLKKSLNRTIDARLADRAIYRAGVMSISGEQLQ
jgi:hypothetical protein